MSEGILVMFPFGTQKPFDADGKLNEDFSRFLAEKFFDWEVLPDTLRIEMMKPNSCVVRVIGGKR